MDKGIEVNDFSKMFLYTLCMNSKIVRSDKDHNKFVYDISLPYRFKDAIIISNFTMRISMVKLLIIMQLKSLS